MMMPATMVHLAVARALAVKAVCDGTGPFYLGSLAPDAVHLLTDALWHDEVILSYRRKVRDDGRWDEMPGLYYRDCDAVDEELFFCCPWRPQIWMVLRQSRPQAFQGLLDAEEVSAWRDHILSRLKADPSPADRWPLYLETAEVLEFVKHAGAVIARTIQTWRGELPARADREATA